MNAARAAVKAFIVTSLSSHSRVDARPALDVSRSIVDNRSMRWMTFDCYGTLLDWQGGFRRILEPFAGARIDALVEAFHAVEPEVERALPAASYKAILREGLARASRRAGLEPTDGDLGLLVDE